MLKKFKEVFQSLECSSYIDELLNFVFVEKVSTSSDMSIIRIHILAERVIDKKIVFELETLIKDKMFSKKNIKIKILEKFKLSTQYTAKNLFEIYKESILLEIKNYKIKISPTLEFAKNYYYKLYSSNIKNIRQYVNENSEFSEILFERLMTPQKFHIPIYLVLQQKG